MISTRRNCPAWLALISLLVLGGLAGCSEFQIGVEGTPSAQVLPSPLATASKAGGSPVRTVEGGTDTGARPDGEGTVAPPDAPAAGPTAAACSNSPMLEGVQALPETENLEWVAEPNPAGPLYRLTGLTSPVLSANPSPDGYWWAVKVLREYVPAGPARVALLVVESGGERHWLANTGGQADFHDHDWLPDGRLVWVQDGFLALGNNTGTERRDLAAPEPIHEVWVGAFDIALASGETALWRLNLRSGDWQKVPGLENAAKNSASPISAPGANLALAPDRTFGAAFIEGGIWKIPLGDGEPATRLTTIHYGGRGGRANPPRPLANSPYWFPGELPQASIPGSDQPMLMVDERDGLLVPLSNLINLHDKILFAPSVSPDGRWVAVPVADLQTSPIQEEELPSIHSVYLARSDQLALGQVVSGDGLAGWLDQPAGAFISDHSAGTTVLSSVLLPDGRAYPLFSNPDPNLSLSVKATARMAFVGAGNRLYALAPDGVEIGAIEIFGAQALGAVPPARALLGGFYTQPVGGGQCTFMPALYLWDIR